jgi:hypothetical protein
VAPFEPQLKTALKTNRGGWGTLVMLPYYIGILNKLNVCNGHIYKFLEKSGYGFLGVVFNEETHGNIRFLWFCRRYTVMKQTTRSNWHDPLRFRG